MNLYDIAIARKLSSGGGGGGDSDFSTAEVTVMGNDSISLPTCESMMGMEGITISNLGDGASAIVPLWKGHLYRSTTGGVEVSGNAELIYGSVIDIYGDCTITIS